MRNASVNDRGERDREAAQHTPGPWRIIQGDLYAEGDERNEKMLFVVSHRHGLVATVEREPDSRISADDVEDDIAHVERLVSENGLADARLIASAPDLLAQRTLLLEALEAIEGLVGDGTAGWTQLSRVRAIARNAINAVRGEE